MDEIFDKYHIILFKNIDNPELIQELKKNLDASAYEKFINQKIKLPSKKKEMYCRGSMSYWPTGIKEFSIGFLLWISWSILKTR